jgi:hypothetical protein
VRDVAEVLQLRVGEERPYHLPSRKASGLAWAASVDGMSSAVEVRKLWEALPYPDDDEDDTDRPPQDEVFMVKGTAPGEARVEFRAGTESRALDVHVRL